MFPIERYKFVERPLKNGTNQVIAISTYCGKVVKGVATCSPEDTYEFTTGMELAAARCARKIAYKRYKRAEMKRAEAKKQLIEAQEYLDKMNEYLYDAAAEIEETENHIANLEKTL
jgi:hypothetical protein